MGKGTRRGPTSACIRGGWQLASPCITFRRSPQRSSSSPPQSIYPRCRGQLWLCLHCSVPLQPTCAPPKGLMPLGPPCSSWAALGHLGPTACCQAPCPEPPRAELISLPVLAREPPSCPNSPVSRTGRGSCCPLRASCCRDAGRAPKDGQQSGAPPRRIIPVF